jgi:intraflagellar transport protein 88
MTWHLCLCLQGRGPGGGTTLLKKVDSSPEEQAKDMEKKVHELLEQSAILIQKEENAAGVFHLGTCLHNPVYLTIWTFLWAGLEKAIECKKRERALSKFREGNGMGEQINIDLTYAVDLNLAVSFHANKDYQEAMDQFTGEYDSYLYL